MIRSPEELRSDAALAVNGGRDPSPLPEEASGIATGAAEAIADVVRSGAVTQWRGGPATRRLESEFARRMGRRFAYFANSGSAALFTALTALTGGREHSVGLTCGYVSALNAAYHAGVRPVFLKTHPNTLVADTSQFIPDDRRCSLLLATHFLGNGVDVPALAAATGASATVIDASQSLGAGISGKPVGSVGDIVSFSGSYRKLLGAGSGGVNVFDDPAFGRHMRTVAYHGIDDREIPSMPGYNFAGGEMEATLAMAALNEIETRIAARRASAAEMLRVLSEAGMQCAAASDVFKDSIVWFKIGVVLPESWLGHREWLVNALRAEGIPAWRYPALAGIRWVRPWMESRGWWGEWESAVLEHERNLWGRVVTLDTQLPVRTARDVAERFVHTLTA